MNRLPISITIIFNDNILNVPMIHLEYDGDHHAPLIRRVCEIYSLNINANNYVEDLLSNNHIIIVTVLNNIALYIPKTITQKQFTQLKELQSYFSTYDIFEAAVFNYSDKVFQTVTDINAFFEYVENNCLEKTRRLTIKSQPKIKQ